MYRRLSSSALLVCILSTLVLIGCAKPMAIKPETTNLNIQKESIGIFSLIFINKYRPVYLPDNLWVRIEPINSKVKTTQHFTTKQAFGPDKTGEREFLISFRLAPGEYRIKSIDGNSMGPMVTGQFSIPINGTFHLTPQDVVYLGRISAVNRQSVKKEEVRSGSVIPLIDQGVTGFAHSTFDVEINDDSESDTMKFVEQFPALKNVTLQKSILPPWERPLKTSSPDKETKINTD